MLIKDVLSDVFFFCCGLAHIMYFKSIDFKHDLERTMNNTLSTSAKKPLPEKISTMQVQEK